MHILHPVEITKIEVCPRNGGGVLMLIYTHILADGKHKHVIYTDIYTDEANYSWIGGWCGGDGGLPGFYVISLDVTRLFSNDFIWLHLTDIGFT